MRLVDSPIARSFLKMELMTHFGTVVKAVVDVRRRVMAVDAELHADEESFLLEGGSRQEDLWGINLYPDKNRDEFIDYTSLINIRPAQGNTSMEVASPGLRELIRDIVFELISYDA